jgi:aldose 1-epimerase
MTTGAMEPQTTPCGGHTVHWLDDGRQRLGLVPGLGGSAAAWLLHPAADPELRHPSVPFHLWRPWFGDADLFSVASLPLVPWSNRVSGGGFEDQGRFHPLQPNRAGEDCPIHGEGWLQPWMVTVHDDQRLDMQLVSNRFMDSPYHYLATQTYRLLPDGLFQELTVTHLGTTPLPYGLGQHPWLLRAPGARLRADVSGVWLSHPGRLPREHTTRLGDWDLSAGLSAHGPLIDNAFTGWSGPAVVEWPDAGWSLTVSISEAPDGPCLLVYRPDAGPSFCVEPVTHPVDAIHLPGHPGLQWLEAGQSMRLVLRWRFARIGMDASSST